MMRYCYYESDSRKWNKSKEINLLRYVYLRVLSMYACGLSNSIASRLVKIRACDANSANEQQVQDKTILSAVVTNEVNLVPKLTQPDRFGVC